MISFVIFFTCCLLHASLEDYCYVLGGDCDYDFLCFLDGDGICGVDENAEVSHNVLDCSGKSGCSAETYSYYTGSGTDTIYVTYSTLKGGLSAIDPCSLDYTISADLYSGAYCDPVACGIVNYGQDPSGADINACFDFCWANPSHTDCSSVPCTSGKQCCADVTSNKCATYCTVNGTNENCCGGPSTYNTVNTAACTAYVGRYPSTNGESYTNCMNNHSNLTACALCKTYYTCCSQYKKTAAVLAGTICDHFCALVPNDASCVKRKECLDALGHEPSAAELEKCGTTMVRLSSFTVAVLLGVIAFFFLG